MKVTLSVEYTAYLAAGSNVEIVLAPDLPLVADAAPACQVELKGVVRDAACALSDSDGKLMIQQINTRSEDFRGSPSRISIHVDNLFRNPPSS